LNVFQMAARMEEAFEEQGKPAWINNHRSVVVEGEVIAPRHDSRTPSAQELIAPTKEIWTERLAEASKKGTPALAAAWNTVPRDQKPALVKDLDDVHKPAAALADAAMREDESPAPAIHPKTSGAGETRDGSNQQQPPAVAGTTFLTPDQKIALARARGRSDRADGVKRSATPLEYRAPDRTSEAFAWSEGWNEANKPT
jgi:hypothetical protein